MSHPPPLDLTEIAEKPQTPEQIVARLLLMVGHASTETVVGFIRHQQQSAVSLALQEAAREFTELVTPMILMGTITDQVAEAVADWLRARAAQGDRKETERA
jgi:hypothetical protein